VAKKKRSFDETRGLVRDALTADHQTGSIYIRDITPDDVTYDHDRDGPMASSKTYQRDYSIDGATDKVTLGDKQEGQMASRFEPISSVPFSIAEFSATDGLVTYPKIKVFELGSYPEKRFALTAEEADSKTIPAFAGVTNDLEHRENLLSSLGELGNTSNLYRDGNDLRADVSVPTWFDSAMRKHGVTPSLSLAFDPRTKEITRNSLVIKGHIPDAKLAAYFSAAHEEATASPRKESPRMNPIKQFLALFSKHVEDNAELKAALDEAVAANNNAQFSAPDPALKAELDLLKAKNEKLEAERAEFALSATKSNAAEFAASLKGHFWPTEDRKALVEALFSQLATDDVNAQVTFSAGAATNRVGMLKALIAGYPEVHMGAEILPTDPEKLKGIKVVFNHEGSAKPAGTSTKEIYDARKAAMSGKAA
jgi:hypothetical protein